MGKVLHQEVAIKLDLGNNFVPTLENERYKMYWDRAIITERPVQHNRPDMVVVDKSEKSCIIIDYAVPLDDNIGKAYQEKKEKYKYLADEIKGVED
nr:unnamed protein product [Callosobruchus analis]